MSRFSIVLPQKHLISKQHSGTPSLLSSYGGTLQNATEELKRLESAFNTVRQGIFTRLHDVVRDQIFLPQPGAQLPESSAQLPEALTLSEAVPPINLSVDGSAQKTGNGSSNGSQPSLTTAKAKQ
jgi:hypothetical protein